MTDEHVPDPADDFEFAGKLQGFTTPHRVRDEYMEWYIQEAARRLRAAHDVRQRIAQALGEAFDAGYEDIGAAPRNLVRNHAIAAGLSAVFPTEER